MATIEIFSGDDYRPALLAGIINHCDVIVHKVYWQGHLEVALGNMPSAPLSAALIIGFII
jgi:hypothetical protein